MTCSGLCIRQVSDCAPIGGYVRAGKVLSARNLPMRVHQAPRTYSSAADGSKQSSPGEIGTGGAQHRRRPVFAGTPLTGRTVTATNSAGRNLSRYRATGHPHLPRAGLRIARLARRYDEAVPHS